MLTCPGERVCRYAMTLRNHCAKLDVGGHRPRAPLKSRCVCALTKPGENRSISEIEIRSAYARRFDGRYLAVGNRDVRR